MSTGVVNTLCESSCETFDRLKAASTRGGLVHLAYEGGERTVVVSYDLRRSGARRSVVQKVYSDTFLHDTSDLVEPGMEHRTIAGSIQTQSNLNLCGCEQKLVIEYQPGKVSLDQFEFENVISEFNAAIKRPVWWWPLFPCCLIIDCITCYYCDPNVRGGCFNFALETVAEKMNTQYAQKRVEFIIRWCEHLDADECDPHGKETYHLVIRQN